MTRADAPLPPRRLGVYADWAAAAEARLPLYPAAPPGERTRQAVRGVLGFAADVERPQDVRSERRWRAGDVRGEEVSWSVGYGPRTRAWVIRPHDDRSPLPAVLALHGHDGFTYHGGEKIADGPDGPSPDVADLRRSLYGGRAYANELARRGFVVLVHDVFLWGSRRFPYEELPDGARRAAELEHPIGGGEDDAVGRYNIAARQHEHVVAKRCALAGTSLAGVVSYEDRVALAYLRSRSDVDGTRVGCVGLSGGGCRAALLVATADDLQAAVIVGMMSTYAAVLDYGVEHHTWMFIPAGLAAEADWPDVAASRAPMPLLVQYCRDDHLFTMRGMSDAHTRIAAHYAAVGAAENYVGEFYDGGHRFDPQMQDAAFAQLRARLLA